MTSSALYPHSPQYTQGAGYKANQRHYESHLNLTGKVLNEQQPAAPARGPVLQSTADPSAPCPSPKKGKEWSGKTGMMESDKFDLPKPASSGVPEVSEEAGGWVGGRGGATGGGAKGVG